LVAVYVHVPYCLQRCPYCDFATEAINPREIPHDAYADAVLSELAARAEDFSAGPVATVFFGGGTPSLLRVDALARILRGIEARFGGAPEEVTVECNPTSLDEDKARALRDAGVTRVSIGVQSLRRPHLRYLGRLHDEEQARAAVRAAARVAALRVTADLMFGMPEQRADELVEDARALFELGARHWSAYALTIEPNTRFGELARKNRLPRLPDDDVARLFEAVDRLADELGMEHYEVSNYACPGERGRHNERYWRGEHYVGLGAGAVGCTPRGRGEVVRYKNVYDVRAYLEAGARGARPPEEIEALSAEDRVREGLMLGLRTSDGVDLVALEARVGVDPRRGRERAIARAVSRGALVDEGVRLRIPKARWLVADDIVASLF
jgi:putative oxygen-independent coproporphyrinogen III oxidase